jgi:acetyl-CoA carboxylase biotin carboxyl carrier protein
VNFKEILELIDKVADRGIATLEIEQAGVKLRIEGKSAGPQVVHAAFPQSGDYVLSGPQPQSLGVSGPAPAGAAAQGARAAEVEEDDAGLHIITSPIVGTFYRAPNPESEAFANVGDHVSKGKVLCIIEAMKLMNEIESDTDGVIARIYPQNGQPIEYGEKLFAIKS